MPCRPERECKVIGDPAELHASIIFMAAPTHLRLVEKQRTASTAPTPRVTRPHHLRAVPRYGLHKPGFVSPFHRFTKHVEDCACFKRGTKFQAGKTAWREASTPLLSIHASRLPTPEASQTLCKPNRTPPGAISVGNLVGNLGGPPTQRGGPARAKPEGRDRETGH